MINSMARSLVTAKKWYRNISAGNPQYSDMELISTVLVGSGGATNVVFSSIPSSYKHLQLRIVGRSNATGVSTYYTGFTFNNDTAGNYSGHYLTANGSTVGSNAGTSLTSAYGPNLPASNATANSFSAAITDILDYSSTSKNKTIRTFTGYTHSSTSEVFLQSGVWRSLAAVTSIECISSSGGSWATGSRISLYGIKG